MLGHANSNAESKNRALKGGFPWYNVTLFVLSSVIVNWLFTFIYSVHCSSVSNFKTLKSIKNKVCSFFSKQHIS